MRGVLAVTLCKFVSKLTLLEERDQSSIMLLHTTTLSYVNQFGTMIAAMVIAVAPRKTNSTVEKTILLVSMPV